MRPSGVLITLLLAGCCAGPQYMLQAYDTRTEVEHRLRYALVATVLSDSHVWAYGEPAGVIKALEEHYRPEVTRELERGVAGVEDAPERIGQALSTARRLLDERGYRIAAADSETAEFVVSVALSWYDDGRLARVGVHVGGELDERFDPFLISLAAVVPAEDPCGGATVERLVEDLLGVLPDWEPDEEP